MLFYVSRFSRENINMAVSNYPNISLELFEIYVQYGIDPLYF